MRTMANYLKNGKYIKKTDVLEILSQTYRRMTNRNFKAEFCGVWDKIRDYDGLEESVVRCANCSYAVPMGDKKVYCKAFSCDVPKEGFCFKGVENDG